MSEPKVVERFGDAQAGDWVWLRGTDNKRTWSLVQISKRGRSSLIVEQHRKETKFDLTTGIQRGNKYGYALQIFGTKDREELWWQSQAYKLSDLIRQTQNVETLKAVAFALGFEERPQPLPAPLTAWRAESPTSVP